MTSDISRSGTSSIRRLYNLKASAAFLFSSLGTLSILKQTTLFQLIPELLGLFVLFRQCCYSLLKEFLVWFQYSNFTIFFVFHLLQISFNVCFNIFKFVLISTQWVLCFIKSVVKLCVSDHFRVNIFYLPVLNLINNV